MEPVTKYYPIYFTEEELAVVQISVKLFSSIPFGHLKPKERYVQQKAKELEKKLEKEVEAIKALDALK